MKKIAHEHHAPFRAADLYLPIVTLGFYGLRRFRPRWLYIVTALLMLAAWICLAYVANTIQEGAEFLVAPAVFVMVIVTFFRLAPPGKGRATTNR
jgi:peptidoglycan/LPS O-acetylase OafA/YrhL